MNTYLSVKWTTSRGRETYGYNICTVRDTKRGTNYRCNGGGYDMTGASFAMWLESTYPERLVEIKDRAHSKWDGQNYNDEHGDLYGMTYYSHNNTLHLDGACGLSSILKIATACDLTVESIYDRKGHLDGMYINDKRTD